MPDTNGIMEITYYTRNVYGAERMYPVGQAARMICQLTETKTLTPWALGILRRHGIESREVLKPRAPEVS
jgi:hypothetical protein